MISFYYDIQEGKLCVKYWTVLPTTTKTCHRPHTYGYAGYNSHRPIHKTALAHWPHFFSQFSTLVSGINSPGFHQDIEFLKDQLDGFIRMLLIPKNSPHQGSDPGLDLEIIMEMISFLNEQVTCQIIRHAMADLEKSDHFEKKLSNFPSGF